MTVSRSAGKFAVKILSLFLCFILTIGVSLSQQERTVNADGSVSISVESWGDGANINITVSGYSAGSTVSFSIEGNHSIDGFSYNFGNGAGTCSNTTEQTLAVTITGWDGSPNGSYYIGVSGTWSDFSASVTNVSSNEPAPTETTPAPTPTSTPKPTATTTPKPTATPEPKPTATPTPANNNSSSGNSTNPTQATAAPASDNGSAAAPAAGGDAPIPPAETTAAAAETTATTAASETTETSDPSETSETDNTLTAGETQETVMAVVGEVQEGETYDQTVVLDETHEDGSPVVMGLNSKTQEELSVEKAKKQLMTASFWIVLIVLIAGASYARYRYLKKKEYKGSEIAINFIPGTSDLIYAIGYHFNLPGKGKDAAPAEASASPSHASFNTASAMKELKKMETTVAATKTAQTAPRAKSSATSVPHKRPKELSVNHAAAVAAAKTAQDAPKTKTSTPSTPSVPHKRPKELSVNHAAAVAAAKTAQDTPKTNTARPSVTATSGSSFGNEAARAARERAEAAKEQLRMRAEARKSKIEEVKREELQQRPPIKRPASLSVNHAAAAAAAATAKENTARSDADVEPTNSPFKPLDRSAEREIYSTPGLRPRKSAEDHQKMAVGANQLGKGIGAQRPEAPYSKNGRAPMWAAPGTGRINPFKPSATAESASAPEAETQSSSAAQPAKTSEHASIADQTTHRSAFFDRAEKARAFTPAKEGRDSRVGDMTRPSGKGKAPHAPTVGMSLEGKDSSILNNGTAPTATEPLPSFKPIDPNK